MPEETVETITFVFSVVCAEQDETKCGLISGKPVLDNFKDNFEAIKTALGGADRINDGKLLQLIGLGVYAGPSHAFGKLPDTITHKRYGRPIIVGKAVGKNIFKNFNNPTEAEMGEDQRKFNFLLHEIFRFRGDNDSPYVDDPRLDQLTGPDDLINPPWDTDAPPGSPDAPPWNAGWVVFPIRDTPERYPPFETMGGHNC